MAALRLLILPVLVIFIMTMQGASCAKILIHPWTTGFNSRLLNMQKMADILAEDGHDVTVLLSDKVRKYNILKKATALEYTTPESAFVLADIDFVEYPKLTLWNYDESVKGFFSFTLDYCKSILSDKKIMDHLDKKNFDLLIVEMFDECNRVLVSHFNVPAISYQNHGYPSYASLMYPHMYGMNCISFGMDNCHKDDMTFMEKFKNMVMVYKFNRLIPEGRKRYEELAEEYDIKLHEHVSLAFEKNLVLLNADHVLHEPWPRMPNVFMISGLFNKPPSPLPKDIEQLVKDSAPHGFIVMSFGTLVSSFKKETAEIFAKVFAKLPQRVFMRYKGELTNKGNNTILSDWLPQADLLSHPLAKAFVTHCGISATFESSYIGVPVVTVPLFAEQVYNSHKLTKRRGMGVQVDFSSLDETSLMNALTEVINNPQYRANATETSKLLHANPIPPKQQFLQLVNYTIKTGGAKHLIHDVGIHLTWYEKLGLDVALISLGAFFAAISMASVLLYCAVKVVRNKFSKTNKPKTN